MSTQLHENLPEFEIPEQFQTAELTHGLDPEQLEADFHRTRVGIPKVLSAIGGVFPLEKDGQSIGEAIVRTQPEINSVIIHKAFMEELQVDPSYNHLGTAVMLNYLTRDEYPLYHDLGEVQGFPGPKMAKAAYDIVSLGYLRKGWEIEPPSENGVIVIRHRFKKQSEE